MAKKSYMYSKNKRMPQFYPTDNLESWFAVCFIEHYESLNEGCDDCKNAEAVDFADMIIDGGEHLQKAEEFLRESNLANDSLVDAIMNSVNWEDVIERFKSAIDYWEAQTHTCYKCFAIYTHETEEAEKEDGGFCECCIKKM